MIGRLELGILIEREPYLCLVLSCDYVLSLTREILFNIRQAGSILLESYMSTGEFLLIIHNVGSLAYPMSESTNLQRQLTTRLMAAIDI